MNAPVCYRVDAEDKLIRFNEEWDRFALANDAPELESRRLYGRRVWDFVSDPATRGLYQDLLRRARDGRSPVFPFRCDSPELKRTLRMTLRRRDAGEVEFVVEEVLVEPRPYAALLDRRAPREGRLVRACGWCRKIWSGAGWVEIEEAVARLGLMAEGVVPPVSHGICGPCEARLSVGAPLGA